MGCEVCGKGTAKRCGTHAGFRFGDVAYFRWGNVFYTGPAVEIAMLNKCDDSQR